MEKKDGCCLAAALPSGEESPSDPQPAQCVGRPSQPIPRFRGVLMCRRCDACGARIGYKGEGTDRVILKCPACDKEYTFFERPE